MGGSDPSSGAGIQSDIKTCHFLGAHCLTVITGVTSQNTSSFGSVELVSSRMLGEQIDMIFSDFEIDAVKIGMVSCQRIIKIIHDRLHDKDVPVVLDPVVLSTTGGTLLENSAILDLKRLLIPMATLVTPNGLEAEFLTGRHITSPESARMAAEDICSMGAGNAVITGLHFEKNTITDCLVDGHTHYFSRKELARLAHGSGCTYSLATCYCLADGMSVRNAVLFARRLAYDSIRNSASMGKGVAMIPPTNDSIRGKLKDGIDCLADIRGIHMHIPECQTNFVFSRYRPSSPSDVLGVEGRIVKTGRSIMTAGRLRYGGSKHVASALLAVGKKFPSVRAAINIMFRDDTVSRMKKAGMVVLDYDRSAEPGRVKNTEGSSIRWGTENAVRTTRRPPDAICHTGDIGKEPMIIVFGRSPADVITKLEMVLE